MEISQKELKDALESGKNEIKAVWRHTPEAHEKELQDKALVLRVKVVLSSTLLPG